MSGLTRQQIHTLKRQLHDARAHVLDAEKAYRAAGDGAGAMRVKELSWQLAAEVESLDLLLAKILPVPVRVT
jgi:hypothetical protein